MGVVVNRERRGDCRRRIRGLTRATLRPGCEVSVIDLSPGGALVETQRPLRPGARVYVRLVSNGDSFSLVANVLRCTVWSIDAEDGIVYRGALQFEHPCAALRTMEGGDFTDGHAQRLPP